jgi:hypothetical protein
MGVAKGVDRGGRLSNLDTGVWIHLRPRRTVVSDGGGDDPVRGKKELLSRCFHLNEGT